MQAHDPERALAVLLDLTRELGERRGLGDALTRVTEAALELLPGEHASIRVLDQSGEELLSGARSGEGSHNQPVRHERGVGVAGWVVEHGEVARIADCHDDPRFIAKEGQGFDIRSMLAVPLWSAGNVIGLLAVTSAHPRCFSERHELLACLLANCAVPPIERARLARLAVTDHHTRAFNQAYLETGLRQEMERHQGHTEELSLLLLDLDHFKEINDRFGHAVGDLALREFADRVRASTRGHDVLVRRGGDEFVLIMPGADKGSALAVATRIRSALAEPPIVVEGYEVPLRVSVGAATWNGVETPEALEKRADDAMYAAKLAGRDEVRWADVDTGPVTVRAVPPSRR